MTETLSPMPDDDDAPFDLEREPLDRPALANDWGGDGTDLSRPVRAHVLAALRPNTAPYLPPLDALIALGDPRNTKVLLSRHAPDVRQEHLPDLLRMVRDRGLYTSNGDTDQVWAPLHAFYALAELDVSAVVPELLPLFDLKDDRYQGELPDLLGKIGAPALEPLRIFLAERARWGFGHWHACGALEQIAVQHPQLREQAVAILCDLLRDAEHYHEAACTGAVDALIELRAVAALPLIRRAFELGKIDEMARGTWGDLLDDLGVEPEAGDPLLAESRRRFEERQDRFIPRQQREQLRAAFARLSGRNQPFAALAAETAGPPAPGQARQPIPQRTAGAAHARPAAGADRLNKPQSYTRAQPKIGRNQPCPCGSGRKYKHCHGK